MLLMPDHLHAVIVFPREPGLQTVGSELEEIFGAHHWDRLAKEFFRPPSARSPSTRRKGELYFIESGSEGAV
jgi:hypothetical protein